MVVKPPLPDQTAGSLPTRCPSSPAAKSNPHGLPDFLAWAFRRVTLVGQLRHDDSPPRAFSSEIPVQDAAELVGCFSSLGRGFGIEHEHDVPTGEDRPDEEFYTFSNHAGYGIDFRSSVLSLYRFKRWLYERQLAEGKMTEMQRRERLDQLEKWEKVIDEDELEPQPIARAAIRWMKRQPPPPAQRLSIVHGDYRTGNFLFDPQGKIRAVLDWEMAHLGDPLEDLAWALDPLWSADRDHPGGMLTRDEAVGVWARASGLRADPAALAWWSIFASLKGLAIWISSAKEYQAGTNTDPVMAFSGLYCLPFHNKRLADMLVECAS